MTMPSYNVLACIADALETDLTTLTREEGTTRQIDADLDAILDRLGISAAAQEELLRLRPCTRAELADALSRDQSSCG